MHEVIRRSDTYGRINAVTDTGRGTGCLPQPGEKSEGSSAEHKRISGDEIHRSEDL